MCVIGSQLQYRHLFPAQSTGRLPVPGCTNTQGQHVKEIIEAHNDPRSLQIKLRSVVTSSMHPCPVNGVAIGRAVVYHARAAHAFSAGIKCRHCSPSTMNSQQCIYSLGRRKCIH